MSKKKYLLILFLGLAYSSTIGQTPITLEEVKSKYGEFIVAYKKQAFDDRMYIDKKVVIPEDSTLAAFVSTNKTLIELLHTNYTTISAADFKNIKDSTRLQNRFIEELKNDDLFNQYCLPFLCHFYKSKGYDISGFKAEKQAFTLDETMDIIVKYFEVTSVDSRGNYKTRIGISEDGLVKTLDKRYPLLEVFCLHLIKKYPYKAYRAMDKAKKVIKKLQLGLNENDRIKRAEGIVYGLISQDEDFRAVIIKANQEQANTLPFVITGIEE